MTELQLNETDFKNMVAELAKPGQAIICDLTAETAHILHMAIGVRGEVDELEKAVHAALLGVEDRPNLVEEMGDIEFYLEGLISRMGVSGVFVFDMAEITNDPLNSTDIRAVSYPAATLLDLAKKMSMYAKKDIESKIRVALAEVRLGLDIMYIKLGITREEAIQANMRKLKFGEKPRYANGYSNQAAQDRADKDGAE